jgi:hypothetical protein
MEVIYLLEDGNGRNSALVKSEISYESFAQSISYISNFRGTGKSSIFVSAPYNSENNVALQGKIYVLNGFTEDMKPNQTMIWLH